jgi:hypothetical protein
MAENVERHRNTAMNLDSVSGVSETNGKYFVLTKTLGPPGGWGTIHFSHLPTAKRFPYDYHV